MLITLDFETYYDPQFSLTKMSTMEYVKDERFKVWGVGIKVGDGPTEWYGEDETETFLNILDWSSIDLVCHNTPFDAYILTQYYGLVPRMYIDTAAMSRGLYPGESARLKDVATRLFPDDESMRKGDELVTAKGVRDLPPDIEELIAGYCIQDVDLTYAIYQELFYKFPRKELKLIDMTTRMFCEPQLTVDRDLLIKYRDEEIERNDNIIQASGLSRKVLGSDKQFKEHLESIDITPATKVSPRTGKTIPAFGKNDPGFKQMQRMYPELQHIWDARTAVKSRIAETRAQRFIDAVTPQGTMPAPLRYYAAHTGRFGGTEKINLQNLPRGSILRKALTAPDNMFVYVADLSNIEARMLAWLAGEHELLRSFKDGVDVYSNFASVIYDKPINKHDNPTERFVGKTAILGLGYGMGPDKFQATVKAAGINMDLDEAQRVVQTYRTTYPGISSFWKRATNLLEQTADKFCFVNKYACLEIQDSRIVLPNGMSLWYPNLEIWGNDHFYTIGGKRQSTWGGRITENIVQALSRIVITDAMLRIEQSLPELKIVLTVHDEIIALGPQEDAQRNMDALIYAMCIQPKWAPALPLDAEGGFDVCYSK